MAHRLVNPNVQCGCLTTLGSHCRSLFHLQKLLAGCGVQQRQHENPEALEAVAVFTRWRRFEADSNAGQRTSNRGAFAERRANRVIRWWHVNFLSSSISP
jgi:hypothetical protein